MRKVSKGKQDILAGSGKWLLKAGDLVIKRAVFQPSNELHVEANQGCT